MSDFEDDIAPEATGKAAKADNDQLAQADRVKLAQVQQADKVQLAQADTDKLAKAKKADKVKLAQADTDQLAQTETVQTAETDKNQNAQTETVQHVEVEADQPEQPDTSQPKQISSDMAERMTCERFVYDGDSSTLGSRWEAWLDEFKLFIAAANMTDQARNKAAFQLLMRREAREICRTLKKADDSEDLDALYKLMSTHFVGKRSEFTEQHRFHETRKIPDEPIDEYHMRLRRLAQHCNFGNNLETEILRQLVPGSDMPEFQRKCCREDNLDLKKALDIARGIERTADMLKGLRANPTNAYKAVNALSSSNRTQNRERRHNQHSSAAQTSSSRRPSYNNRNDTAYRNEKCPNCGYSAHNPGSECPAKGLTCRNCQKPNHFANVCRSSKVEAQGSASGANAYPSSSRKPQTPARPDLKGSSFRAIEHEEDCHMVNSQDYADFIRFQRTRQADFNALHEPEAESDGPHVNVTIRGTRVRVLVDTGAPMDIIDEDAYHSIVPKPKLFILIIFSVSSRNQYCN